MKFGSISTPIIADGLVFNMDAANRASTIPSTSTDKAFNTVDLSQSGSFINDTIYDSSTITPSFAFDGSADYINYSADQDYGKINTISLWYNRPSSATQVLFGNSANNAWYNYTVRIATDGGIKYATDAQVGQVDFNSAGTKALANVYNAWVNITITRVNDACNCYINAVDNDGEKTFSNGSRAIIVNKIGIAGDNASFAFTGNIGPIHVYNRALSASEVLHNYNALKGRFI